MGAYDKHYHTDATKARGETGVDLPMDAQVRQHDLGWTVTMHYTMGVL